MVSDKKIFIFPYKDTGKRSQVPWHPCFFMNPDGLNNFVRGLSKENFCQIILKLVQWFLRRRFLKFSIKIYRENKSCPLAAMFFGES